MSLNIQEIEIVTNLKNNIQKLDGFTKEEKAIILKALDDYFNDLIFSIKKHNQDVSLMKEDGIFEEKIELPKIESTPNPFYDSLVLVSDSSKVDYLKKVMDIFQGENSFDFSISDQELKILLKALRDYAYTLQVNLNQKEKSKSLYEEIFQETYPSSQTEEFTNKK